MCSAASKLYAQVTAGFTFTASPASLCPPVNVTFTNTSSPAAGTTYSWVFGNGNTSTAVNPGASYPNAGTYTITLTALNGGISSTHTATVTVNAKPVAGFTTSAMPSCTGHAVNFTDNSTPGSASISSWLWDFGDAGQSNAAGSVTHAYSTAGANIPVSLIVTDANGCSNSILKTATIVTAPTASFTGSPTSSCSPPLNVIFNNTSSITGAVTYLWRFGDGTTSTLTSPSHNYTSLGVNTVTLIVTQGSCKDSVVSTNFVSILNSTSADFVASSTSVCSGQAVSFYDWSSPGTANQLWDFGDGAASTNTNPIHTYSAVGIYTVKLTEGPPGCQNTRTKSNYITVSQSPVAAFTANLTQSCDIPFNVTFGNTSTAGAVYNWNFGDWTTHSALKFPVHSYTSAGIYNVSLTVTIGGCAVTHTEPSFIVIPDPHANFGGIPRKGCVPLPVNFSDSSYSYFDPITSYKWNFGNGTAVTSSPSISNTYNSLGSFNVKLVVQTSRGCKDSTTKINYIKTGGKPKPGFIAVSSPVCYGTAAVFTDQSIGGDSAYWQFDMFEGTFSTPPGAAMPFNPVTNIFPDTGSFFVKQTVFNNGCDSSVQKDHIIKILPPKPIFSYQLNCSNYYSVDFFSSSLGADSIVWDFGDGSPLLSNTIQPTHVFAARGSIIVTLTAYNFAANCSSSISQLFTIAEPKAQFSASLYEGCFPLNLNFSNTSLDLITDYWIFGDGNSDTSTAALVNHTYFSPKQDTVKLVITDINGCKDTASSLISVYGPTPNFSSNLFTGCAPLRVTLTDASVSDSALVEWTWNFGDGTLDTITANHSIKHTYSTPGFYNVTMTVKDKKGCSQMLTKYQYIRPTYPFPAFTVDSFACRNEWVGFNAFSTSVAYPAKFKWNFGDGIVDSTAGSYITHAYTSDNLYTVTLNVTDVNGCDSSVLHKIRIQHPHAAFTDSVPSVQCGYTQMHYRDISTGLALTQWYWIFGDGAFSYEQNPNHNYTVPGPYIVTLRVTNSAGCENTTSDSVLVPGPTGVFSFSPQTGCTPLTITFIAVSQSASSYTWDFGDGFVIANSPDSVIQHTYTDTITVTPQLILNSILPNGTPCTLSASTQGKVTVTHPYPAFTADAFACRNEVVVFDASGTIAAAPAVFKWNFGDGSPSQTLGVPTTSHAYTSDNLYTVTLTVIDVHGCDSSVHIQHQIRIQHPSPAFTYSVFSELCNSTEMLYTDLSTGFNINGRLWDFGDNSTDTAKNPHHIYTHAGSYIVTLTVTNSSGCQDMITRTVFVPGPTAGTFSFTPHIGCLPLTATFTALSSTISTPTSYTWDFGGSFVISNSPDSIIQHTYLDTLTAVPKLYLNFLLPNGTTCTLPPDSAGVLRVKTIFPAFTADTFACRNEAVVFNASATIAEAPAIYKWNFGDGSPSQTLAVPIISHTYTSDNLYTVTLTVTDANGCDTSIHIHHQIRIQHPSAAFSDLVLSEECDSTEMQYTDNSTGLFIVGRQWNFGDNSTDTSHNPHHSYTIPGTYNVKLVVTNSSGCKDSLSKSVFVPGPTTGTFSFTPHNGCLPHTVTFISVSSANIPPSSYTWDFGDGSVLSNSPDSIVQHTYPDTITAVPHLVLNFILPNGTTCILPPESAGTVKVNTIFPAFFSAASACRNTSVVFNASSTIAAAPATYSWNFGDGSPIQTAAVPIINHTYTSDNLYTVTLTVKDANGCDTSMHIQHQIRIQNPHAAFTDSVFLEGCNSTEMQYTDNSTGLSIIGWQWNFGDNSTDTQQNPSHIYSNPGSYIVKLVVTNSTGCKDSLSRTVFVPGPTAGTFSFTPHIGCLPLAVTFTSVSSANIPPSSYTWDFGDGSVLSNSPDSIVQHTYHDTITATPQLILNFIIPNGTTCILPPESAGTLAVKTVFPAFVTDTFACRNAPVAFDASATIANPPAVYTWNFGDGFSDNSSGSIANHAFTSNNLYTVTLTVIDVFGCDNSIHIQHQIRIQNPQAAFTNSMSMEWCDSIEMSYIDNSTGLNIIKWHWTFGDGTTDTIQNPHHNYSVSGTYNVTLLVTNIAGCTDLLSESIIVTVPTGTFSFSPDAGCPPLTVEFSTLINAPSYIWDLGNGITLDTAGSIVHYSYQDTISAVPDLNIVLSNGTHCHISPSTVPAVITVHPIVTAKFSLNSTSFDLPKDIMICSNQSEWANTYNWSFGDGSASTLINPQYLYQTIGNYQIQLIAMSQFGCADTAYAEITTNTDVVFPNAFTPDPDGNTGGSYDITNSMDNNTFFPYTSGVIEYQLVIFNSWGEQIFESLDIKKGWDGYYRGKLCEQGVYVWKAYLKLNNGKEYYKNGDLTLLR